MKGIFQHSSFFSRILLLLIVFLFVSIFGITFGIAIIGIDETNVTSMKHLQLFQSVFTFLLPPFIVAYLWSERPLHFLKLDVKVNWKMALFTILLMILIVPCINLLTELNGRIVLPDFLSRWENYFKEQEVRTTELTERFLTVNTFSGFLLNVLVIAVIPALGEELFFRGTIQRVLADWKGNILAIWVTAFIFSAIHFQFYGFIPRLLIGAFLGYLLVWSKSLWLPIIAHFINNFIVILYYYLINKGFNLSDINTVGTSHTWWIGLLSAIVFISGIYFIRKYYLKEKIEADS